MKKVLFDTNVVLDVLLDRQPYAEASAAAWAAVETGIAEGMLAAHAVTTIHYLVQKEMGSIKARRIVSALLRVFRVAAVDGAVAQEALQLPFSDFEDAVTAAAARVAGCECVVTRDPKGFRGSPVRSLTPEALLPLLNIQVSREPLSPAAPPLPLIPVLPALRHGRPVGEARRNLPFLR